MKSKRICKFMAVLFIIMMLNVTQYVPVFAATVGEQLLEPEEGWQRIDDTDENISYVGEEWEVWTLDPGNYNSTSHYFYDNADSQYIKFRFYGNKIRLIMPTNHKDTPYTNCLEVYLDGIQYTCDLHTKDIVYNTDCRTLVFEKLELENEIHEVILHTQNKRFTLDAIDINEDGYMVKDSINIQQKNINVINGDCKPILIDVNSYKYTTSSVLWTSSDDSIATVDSNGTVTGIKAGTATITAYIEGTELSDTCTVEVTEENKPGTDEPDPIPNGSYILRIELVDGNIKEFNVTEDQLTDFIQWFKDRDRDDTESPIYKFKKNSNTSTYLVHDKIVAFDVVEN